MNKKELEKKSKKELIEIILEYQNKLNDSVSHFQNITIADGTKGMQRGI